MNKSFIFLFVFVIVTTFVRAQTSSGNMMAGGSFEFSSYSRQSGSNADQSSVGFNPSFGYFVSDDLVVGGSLSLGSSRSGTGDAKSISNSFSIGPFARYYFFTSNEQFGFFGQAGLNFGSGKTDPAVGRITQSNFISFALQPGAAYFFNEHWALEFSITGLRISSADPDTSNNNDKVSRVDFGLGTLSPNLGFRYHF